MKSEALKKLVSDVKASLADGTIEVEEVKQVVLDLIQVVAEFIANRLIKKGRNGITANPNIEYRISKQKDKF